jgi:uncharacterized SAM-binding protein YcdF (DUF218 family)
MDSLRIITLEIGKAILVPSTALILTLAAGVFMFWSPLQKAGRWVVTITAITLVLVAIAPISQWIAAPLERRFPLIGQLPDSVVGIVVLGGALERDLTAAWSQPQLNGHAERLTTFLALARKYPNLQLVFSGGAAAFDDQMLTEADIAQDLFGSLGIDTARVIFERRSRNTCENAIYTAQLVKPTKQQTWVLITSAMDMPRAAGAFRKAGFRILPYPVDYTTNKAVVLDLRPNVPQSLDRLDHAAHEWFGSIAYRLLGCTDSFFPGP